MILLGNSVIISGCGGVAKGLTQSCHWHSLSRIVVVGDVGVLMGAAGEASSGGGPLFK
ncbi:MAG: hypothetical protein ACFB0D_12815 [Phormidesmis sp.]